MDMQQEMLLAENEILKHEVARLREREVMAKKLLTQAAECVYFERKQTEAFADRSHKHFKRLMIIRGYVETWKTYSWINRIFFSPYIVRKISGTLYAD